MRQRFENLKLAGSSAKSRPAVDTQADPKQKITKFLMKRRSGTGVDMTNLLRRGLRWL
jgi:hypothetical protein